MNEENHQRRHYLIAYRFQLGFIFKIVLLVIFTSVVIGWSVYYKAWNVAEDQIEILLSRGHIDQEGAVQFRQAIRSSFYEKALLRFLLLIFIAFVPTIIMTHRLVGPIYHMEKTIQNFLDGKPVRPIKLRKKDEFHTLAALLNRVMEDRKSNSKVNTPSPPGSD